MNGELATARHPRTLGTELGSKPIAEACACHVIVSRFQK